MMAPAIPLAGVADRWLQDLAEATGSPALAAIEGATLLGERAMLRGLRIGGRISPGGGCRLFDAADGLIALNLARASDGELLPALFEADINGADDQAIASACARSQVAELVARGRELGMAIAHDNEEPVRAEAAGELVLPRRREPRLGSRLRGNTWRRPPRVLDLSSLWAGPLASHLLQLAGADVIKLESTTRPDAMRWGEPAFFALLNQGKVSVQLDFADREALVALIAQADIVIEAARPRALAQLGIDADALVSARPNLVWLTITAHGATGEAANWVGFGDDVGVAAGLTAAMHAASGHIGFVGDAIADPLTGIHAARLGWEAWSSGQGGRFGIAMSGVARAALAGMFADDAAATTRALSAWGGAAGSPFPTVQQRASAPARPLGADTASARQRWAAC